MLLFAEMTVPWEVGKRTHTRGSWKVMGTGGGGVGEGDCLHSTAFRGGLSGLIHVGGLVTRFLRRAAQVYNAVAVISYPDFNSVGVPCGKFRKSFSWKLLISMRHLKVSRLVKELPMDHTYVRSTNRIT